MKYVICNYNNYSVIEIIESDNFIKVEKRLKQLNKEYIEESKLNLKVGKCFAQWQGIIYTYFKIIEVNINKHRPIKAIKVINNQSIEIIELYLKDYSFILDISTKQFNDIYSETLETISNYYEQE